MTTPDPIPADSVHGTIYNDWDENSQWKGRTIRCYCCGRDVRVFISSDRYWCNAMCQLRVCDTPENKNYDNP